MPVKKPPPGACPQCWQHAYDPSIHRRLKPREDCPQCLDHLHNGCPTRVPSNSIWW